MSRSFNQHPVYFHLRKSFQQTKTHLSLANLNSSLIAKNPQIFSYFLQIHTKKLRSTRNLKRLTLDLDGAQLDPITVNHLFQGLIKHLPHLESFKIIFCSDNRLFTNYLDFLLKALRSLPNLKTFEISLSRMLGDTSRKCLLTEMIKRLRKSAPKLKDVRITYIDSISSFSQVKREPELNTWGIKRLTNLQNLTLHLPRTAFLYWDTETEGKFDLSALRRFVKLKSLNISLVDFTEKFRISPSQGFTFDPRGLFPNLRKFKWDVSYYRLQGVKGLQLLGPTIASLYPLEEFSLKFKQFYNLEDSVIEAWSQNIASLKTDLNQLHLACGEGELTSKGAETLITALARPKLKKMGTFCLELIDCKGVNNGFLVKLGQAIAQNFGDLRFLKIRFEYHQELSSGLSGAWKSIFRDEGITDKGIEKFGEVLAERCGHLELVWLQFGKYGKISDRGTEKLCEKLGKIESLKKVWLKFRLCSEVSAMGGKYAKERLGGKREVKFDLF